MIKIKFVYGCLPVIVIYADKVPIRGAGWTYGPVILIKIQHVYEDDLLAHELYHVKRWYKRMGKDHSWEEYKKEEITAIRIQLRVLKQAKDAAGFDESHNKLCNDMVSFFGIAKTTTEAKILLGDI
jgi:hypothetical protein